eukprot:TRINITY_DN9186_c0_g1_i6.p5 TRINITY_DN9186_c0_g1~~TRINITY_DN9186_c0_g1_i6.p5  ORF type:complete len:122 (-),score=48.79 TRINITY_DN9186_c0_g1_i6:508-873(-)
MPEYEQEIIKIGVDTGKIRDLELRAHKMLQQESFIKHQIQKQRESFEDMKVEESEKYDKLMLEFDETITEMQMVDKQIEECDLLYKEEFLRTQSSILEATHKVKSLDISIDKLLNSSTAYS